MSGEEQNQKHAQFILFFLKIHQVVHCEFVPEGKTGRADLYNNILWCLRENIQRKRSEQQCVPSHASSECNENAFFALEFFAQTNTIFPEHLDHSPDLAAPQPRPLPENQNQVERLLFWYTGEDPMPIAEGQVQGDKNKKLSENSYQAHETTDRQQQNLNQVRFYIFMVLSSEHFDHIFYITLLIQNLRTLFSQDSPNYISHSLCQASIKHIINVLLINCHNCKVG